MRPTLEPGDRLLVEPLEPGSLPPRGAIVVLPDPEDPARRLVKRVAAVPGDPNPAAAPGDNPDVPPGRVVVLSDARDMGRDSRRFGPVPVATLVGVAWWRYAPNARRGALPGPTPP